jgi:hypothetical protein
VLVSVKNVAKLQNSNSKLKNSSYLERSTSKSKNCSLERKKSIKRKQSNSRPILCVDDSITNQSFRRDTEKENFMNESNMIQFLMKSNL